MCPVETQDLASLQLSCFVVPARAWGLLDLQVFYDSGKVVAESGNTIHSEFSLYRSLHRNIDRLATIFDFYNFGRLFAKIL